MLENSKNLTNFLSVAIRYSKYWTPNLSFDFNVYDERR